LSHQTYILSSGPYFTYRTARFETSPGNISWKQYLRGIVQILTLQSDTNTGLIRHSTPFFFGAVSITFHWLDIFSANGQTFHVLYHTDNNVLLGAPTGSGKTISAELAMLRLFNTQPDMKVCYSHILMVLDRTIF
jgi:hypothetical protein